jgi:hypothetical protein
MTGSSSMPPASTERYNRNAVMGGLSGRAAELIAPYFEGRAEADY